MVNFNDMQGRFPGSFRQNLQRRRQLQFGGDFPSPFMPANTPAEQPGVHPMGMTPPANGPVMPANTPAPQPFMPMATPADYPNMPMNPPASMNRLSDFFSQGGGKNMNALANIFGGGRFF